MAGAPRAGGERSAVDGLIPPLDLSLLCAVALATAVLSAVVGMAGGITLLTVMLLWLEPLVVIPLHGVIQLVSNGSRTWFQRRHVDWGILVRYAALLVPMGFVGLAVARALPPSGTRLLIGLFVLAATWRPGWVLLGTHPEQTGTTVRFVGLGAVVGVLNMTIGAVGPLIAPFFLNLGLARQALIGTKAACQTLGHLVKISIFGIAGFAYLDYAIPLLLLSLSVVIGTWLGSRLLDRVSERGFTRLYKTVLTLIALRLVLGEALHLVGR
jgi:uncharacterized membrane protein YfcA